MVNQAYSSAVKSLGVSIFLLELALAGTALLLVFALEDSIRILSIFGIFAENFESNLWVVWPIILLNVIAIGWSEFAFLPKVKVLFEDENNAIEKFGSSSEDEATSLADLRITLNKYAIFVISFSFAAAIFIAVSFVNILIAGILLALQFALLMMFREKAKLLKADEVLLT